MKDLRNDKRETLKVKAKFGNFYAVNIENQIGTLDGIISIRDFVEKSQKGSGSVNQD